MATTSRRFAPETRSHSMRARPHHNQASARNTSMASIHREIQIDARPDEVWAAVRDFGAVHQRLARGFVLDARLDGDARVVTFANGTVARELLVDCDDAR